MSNYLISTGITFNRNSYYVHPEYLLEMLRTKLKTKDFILTETQIKSIIEAIYYHVGEINYNNKQMNKFKKHKEVLIKMLKSNLAKCKNL